MLKNKFMVEQNNFTDYNIVNDIEDKLKEKKMYK